MLGTEIAQHNPEVGCLSTGMVSLKGGDTNGDGVTSSPRTLRYTFSTPLVLRSFLLAGIAYTAPKSGQLAPPFSASEDVFSVTVSAFPGESSFEAPRLMGDLKLVRAKPVFVYRAEAGPTGGAPFVKTATMSFVPAMVRLKADGTF